MKPRAAGLLVLFVLGAVDCECAGAPQDAGTSPADDAGRDGDDAGPPGDDAGQSDVDAGAPGDDTGQSDVDAGPEEEGLAGIPGDPAAVAADAMPDLDPVAFDDDDLDVDGRVTTRVNMMLSPTVTVAEVNAVLVAQGLRLAWGSPVSLSVGVIVPAQATLFEAEALVSRLVTTGAFIDGQAPYVARNDALPDGGSTALLAANDNLVGPRFYAAWNAAALSAGAPKMTVLVVDAFFHTDGDPRIPSLRFDPGARATPRVFDTIHEGNHGYWVAGILGATFDRTTPTGTSPDPARLVDLVGIDSAHLDPHPLVKYLGEHAPPTGRFVVSASYGYNDPQLVRHHPLGRALDALEWRRQMLTIGDRALIICSAGNDGAESAPPDARLNSPLTIQASFDDLRDIFPSGDPHLTTFEFEWARSIALDARLGAAQGSTVIVGSAQVGGAPLLSSTPGHDVRMVGQSVLGACVVEDDGCLGTLAGREKVADGTSAATPALAGAASYLWSLAPTLTPAELRTRLGDAADGDRWVDVYTAVLNLEGGGGPNLPVRKAIVDVTGALGFEPDGLFDEGDIALIASTLDDGTVGAIGSATKDYSRFDLNGDGFTRTDTSARMDINANGTIGFARRDVGPAGAPLAINEATAGDLDVLCFMAYGPDFTGSSTEREALLGPRCGSDPAPTVVWEGTVEYSHVDAATHSTSCGSTYSERIERHIVAAVTCTGSSPDGGLECRVTTGAAEGVYDSQPHVTSNLQTGSYGSTECMSDADCGLDPVCVPAGTCGVVQQKMCGTCAHHRVLTESNIGSGTMDLDALAGTLVLMVGPAVPGPGIEGIVVPLPSTEGITFESTNITDVAITMNPAGCTAPSETITQVRTWGLAEVNQLDVVSSATATATVTETTATGTGEDTLDIDATHSITGTVTFNLHAVEQ